MPQCHGLSKILWLLIVILIGLRCVLLVILPQTDTTEARYAEISRKMVETANWVTPQSEYGVPFWAKPPLSMWLSAGGMELFGCNEFGSRIFIFAASVLTLLLVYRVVCMQLSKQAALVSVLVLLSMPTFFVSSGMVMTDGVLVLGTTLAMLGFWLAMSKACKRYGYLFFVGLAIGLMAKGPLALVLAGMPIGLWVVLSRRWKDALGSVPWLTGTLLMLVIAVPWYIVAEMKTPGFFDYFIVGEHLSRFIKSDWSGDKYGRAHSMAKGMIWVFWLVGIFPWFLVFLAVKNKTLKAFARWTVEDNQWHLYLLLWALWPLVFFTPAANIIAAYPLPALPACAMLVGTLWYRHQQSQEPSFLARHFAKIALGVTLMYVGSAVIFLLWFPQVLTHHSQKGLVAWYHKSKPPHANLVYWGKFANPRNQRLFSAEFYTQGSVLYTDDIAELARLAELPTPLYFAIKASRTKEIPAAVLSRFSLQETFVDYVLFAKR